MASPKKSKDQQLAEDELRRKRAEGLASREVFSEREKDPDFMKNLERLRAERREREGKA